MDLGRKLENKRLQALMYPCAEFGEACVAGSGPLQVRLAAYCRRSGRRVGNHRL